MNRVFFTDRDLGKQFPQVLRSAGLTVERHADHFPPECADEDWLRQVGRLGWVALTHNRRIRYTPNQLKAVMEHAVPLLIVVGHARYADLAHAFVATLPRIEAFLAQHTPPFIAKVYRPAPVQSERRRDVPGRIELWYPR